MVSGGVKSGQMLSDQQLEAIRKLGVCTVSNAIERFEVRLRNEGFSDGSIHSLYAQPEPAIGYAVTARVRFSGPPPAGHTYFDRTDWWNYLLSLTAPKLVVIEDCDPEPGSAAFIGEVHANILRALGCVGAITNGAFRDVPEIQKLGFGMFGAGAAVSHSYAHLVEFGNEVEIGGLKISSGDLLMADCHGVLQVPREIASDIPAKASELSAHEQAVIRLCQSKEFSLEKLREAVRVLG
jgi:4-hydroxy-4-methyl-2-oxoglutarate aldolase